MTSLQVQCYSGRMAAAPVFPSFRKEVAGGIVLERPSLKGSGMSSTGASFAAFAALDFGGVFGMGNASPSTGSPWAVRSCFHRSHVGPPPNSMSSSKIFEDHLLFTSSVFEEPSPRDRSMHETS